MYRVIPYILYSLVIGSAIVYYNMTRIPVGNEMGAIAQMFITFVLAIVILVITIIVSGISHRNFIDTKNYDRIQFLIHTISIVLLSFMSWKVCVYKRPSLSREEVRSNQLDELRYLRQRGENILKNADLFKPDYGTLINDEDRLETFLKGFLNRSVSGYDTDSAYHILFRHFFNRVLYNLDSVESLQYRSSISKSLTNRLTVYSPDEKFVLAILTYNTGIHEGESNALVLLGEKENNSLKMFRLPCFRNDYGVVNQDYAYYSAIVDIAREDMPCHKNSSFNKDFWKGGFFESVTVDGEEKYLFQLNLLYNQPGKLYDQTPVPFFQIFL